MKQLLSCLCLFTMLAAIWLGVMENVLEHPGYAARTFGATSIELQSIGTLLFLLAREPSRLRYPILASAVAIALLGGAAVTRILQGQHFEGFVLVIGVTLVLQGVLTLTMWWPKYSQPTVEA